MKCRDAVEMINSYYDNNIDPMKDKILAAHIESCPACRAELDFLNKYRGLLKTVKPVSPPDNFISELHRKIDLKAAENPAEKLTGIIINFHNSIRFPLEAAGVLAAAVLVFFLYKPFFNEKIPVTPSEYGVDYPQGKTSVKKEIPEVTDKYTKSIELKNPTAAQKETVSRKEIQKETIPGIKADDADLPVKGADSYGSVKADEMKKTFSEEREKSVMQSEENSFSAKSTDAKGAVNTGKITASAPDSGISKIFTEYGVSVIRKDLSDNSRLYYRIKVESSKYPLFIKRIRKDFIAEERIIKKGKPYYEIEIFLNKK